MTEFANPCPASGVLVDVPTHGLGAVSCPTCGRGVSVIAGRYEDHARPAIDPATIRLGRRDAEVDLSFGPVAIVAPTADECGVSFKLYSSVDGETARVLVDLQVSFDAQVRPTVDHLRVQS